MPNSSTDRNRNCTEINFALIFIIAYRLNHQTKTSILLHTEYD
ncbi:MAG: hypothetical protein OFPI_18640 [Osedax symbiont Rs2]|nr:MAG: hypothetical protein OFPI_18640 [Osedax symbiont Rs2]